MNHHVLERYFKNKIKNGSKSFFLASFFFPSKTKKHIYALYAWCRFCDDQIDQAPTQYEAQKRLTHLKELTYAVLNHQTVEIEEFLGLKELILTYKIPDHYFLELLEGMQMDVIGYTYHSFEELQLYCYRVASTVGLIIIHIVGVSDVKALEHGLALGKAMQLTNIARDIMDDHALGRVYLPEQWLDVFQLTAPRLTELKSRAQLVLVVKKLLNEAEKFYTLGKQGIQYLPFSSACAVAVAAEVYGQIGEWILKKKHSAWDTRTVVPTLYKLYALLKGLFLISRESPMRILKPWKRIEINSIRRS